MYNKNDKINNLIILKIIILNLSKKYNKEKVANIINEKINEINEIEDFNMSELIFECFKN